MTAFGEVILYSIYFNLGSAAIIFFIRLFFVKSSESKISSGILGITFVLSIVFIWYTRESGRQEEQIEHVGTYYLTDYPNCDNCICKLNEDNTFYIYSGSTIYEKGDWHFESGGDYLITYLHGDKYQLGCGNYKYHNYKLKYESKK